MTAHQTNLFAGTPSGGEARTMLARDDLVTYDPSFLDAELAAHAFAAEPRAAGARINLTFRLVDVTAEPR